MMTRIRFMETGGSGREISVPGVGAIYLDPMGSKDVDVPDYDAFLADPGLRSLVGSMVLGWIVVPSPGGS